MKSRDITSRDKLWPEGPVGSYADFSSFSYYYIYLALYKLCCLNFIDFEIIAISKIDGTFILTYLVLFVLGSTQGGTFIR